MNKRKIINDPVFGFVTLSTDKVYDVLQHPFVQRLGRIRQLGLSYYVYPGAQHSRFSHSIGAMHLMQEGLSMLQQKGVPISSEENEAAQIAILLHDVGHGPFSHVLEHTLVHGITHEEISLMMMEQIDKDLATKENPHPLGLAIDIFRNAYSRHFFHQLLSSQLDVDRMDYLCRDSFFCGVQEGRVASERLLKMLHVVNDHLVVEQKGIYSVEKFLVARRLMYWQVYLHKTSVAAEQLLIKILLRAKELAAQGKELFCSPALHYFLYNHISAEDMTAGSEALRQYALLDDSDVVSAIKAWMDEDDRTLALLCEMFVNRRLFHGTLRKEHLTKAEKDALSERLAKALAIRKEEVHYFYQEHISTSNTYSEKADSIDILYQDGAVKDISEASEILDLKLLTFKPQKLYLFEARTE
ncbi:MAG: HD domain-containing protein [Paludibacteraceae bacterium]|nr:HD domain-containing protein [Paludibacteraceae bacterium]